MEQQETHAKAKWAQTLGVSKSGYYAWLETREERQERDQAREKKVLEVYEESQGHYGAERICGVIRKDGGHASFEVVKGIMERHKLKSSHCRRRQRSLTDSRKARDDRYENLTNDMTIERPFQVLSVISPIFGREKGLITCARSVMCTPIPCSLNASKNA